MSDGSGTSLTRRVVVAGSWMVGLRAAEKALSVVRNIVLARLLAPDDFGLFGIALLTISVVQSLSRTGFQEALVQRDGDIEPYLGTAFTTHAARGLLLAALLYGIAPWSGAFFGEAAAVAVTRVLALNLVIVSLTNPRMALFQRQLAFQKVFTWNMAGTAVDFVVSVAAALALRNAWALVLGGLAGSLARTLVSWVVAGPVRPAFHRRRFREMAGFGRWVWGASIVHLLLNEGDDIVVGKLLGTPALGLYRMAFLYANLPATEITHVVAQVTFPAFARLQADLGAVRRGFLRTLRATALASAPLAGGILVMAPGFVRLVLGPAWLPSVAPLQILAAWGFLRSVSAATGPVFQGIGRPELITKIGLLKLTVLAAAIYPLTTALGLAGAAAAVTVASLVGFPVASVVVLRVLDCEARPYLEAWLYPVVGALAMMGGVAGLHRLSGPGYGFGTFGASVLLGAAIYGIVIAGFRRFLAYDPGFLPGRT